MSAFKVDVVVKISTIVNHPSLTHDDAARSVGLGRVHTLIQHGMDIEAVSDYEIKETTSQELVNYLGDTLNGKPIVYEVDNG